ncbi:hypothetical protein ACO0QE_001044 [Hanseniaspora vineae]
MGHFLSKVKHRWNKSKSSSVYDYKVIMFGLDHVGKTTIFYKLQAMTCHKGNKATQLMKDMMHTVPTIGFNCETITYNAKKLNIWDIGGLKMEALCRFYFPGATDLIYVVDSSDRHRLEETKKIFYELISDKELEKIRITILCNKQDLEGSLSTQEIIDYMNLERYIDKTKQQWRCFGTQTLPSSSTQVAQPKRKQDDGLAQCLQWITSNKPIRPETRG